MELLRSEAVCHKLEGRLVIVGVSGGPDSVALWHLLCHAAPRLGMRLHLAHVDHGWRPQDARREADICTSLAQSAGAGYSIVHLPRPDRRSEEAAREARLSVLQRLASGLGAAAVALAHHEDDQAETVVMQLLRGSARAAGMPSWRPPFWRPLLRVPKERLLGVCRSANLAYTIDPTNLSDQNLRSRVRRGVLPLLRQENPRVAATLARNAGLRAEDDALLQSQARALVEDLRHVPGGIDVRPLASVPAPLARRALRMLLARRGVEAPMERVADMLSALQAGRRLSPARDLMLEGGILWWGAPKPDAVALQDGMRVRYGDLWLGIGNPPKDAVSAKIPKGVVTVRGRMPGDRLQTTAGTRKLQDLLVDEKVARRLRDLIPIFMIDGVPFWLPGQPWPLPAASTFASERVWTAWAAPAQVVTSVWSVLK